MNSAAPKGRAVVSYGSRERLADQRGGMEPHRAKQPVQAPDKAKKAFILPRVSVVRRLLPAHAIAHRVMLRG